MICNNRLTESNFGITHRFSVFGWVVIGKEQTKKTPSNISPTFFVQSEPEKLQRFWKIEEFPTAKLWTSDEKRCDRPFRGTTKRITECRFIVQLPIKFETNQLGDSFVRARRRIDSLKCRLEKQPELFKRCKDFIEVFLNLGHLK